MTGSGVQPLRHGPLLHDDGTVTFRVWAPRAHTVDLLVDERRLPLTTNDDSWYRGRVEAGVGTRYAFSLDGGPGRPDPASLHQPDGVHAPSAVVDRSAFVWPTVEAAWQPAPWSTAAIYELHVGTFTREGTFTAAIDHLASLADVGITHVEVMPVAAFNGPRGWGYDGVSWYAVHEPYGGPAAFAAFVAACHAAGLAVILDVVYNHFGPSGSYHAEFGPYLTERHTTPWGPAINLDDVGAEPVRAFIVDNALLWIADFHVDGLRLDAIHALRDTTTPHVLTELSAAADQLGQDLERDVALIAESDLQDPATVQPRSAGGTGMTAQWLDDLHHALHVTVSGESDGYYVDYTGLADVAAAYARGFVYDGRWSPYRRREVGAPLPATVSGRQFVACVQNHDQIGNRAQGDRLTTLVDADRMRFAISLLCLAPTTPMVFMGEEFGETNPFLFFTSHPEPLLADAVRTGRRAEFAAFDAFDGTAVPDPQDPSTHAGSILDRTRATTPAGRARRRLWTDLLALRRSTPALATGDRTLVELVGVTDTELVIRRDGPDGAPPVVIVANAADAPAPFSFGSTDDLVLAWSSDATAYGGRGSTIAVGRTARGVQGALPAWTVAVLTTSA